MLYKTFQTFEDRIEYAKTKQGHWRARFQGIVDVNVESSTLRRCQMDIMQAFDDRLAELVPGGPRSVTAKRGARRASSSPTSAGTRSRE